MIIAQWYCVVMFSALLTLSKTGLLIVHCHLHKWEGWDLLARRRSQPVALGETDQGEAVFYLKTTAYLSTAVTDMSSLNVQSSACSLSIQPVCIYVRWLPKYGSKFTMFRLSRKTSSPSYCQPIDSSRLDKMLKHCSTIGYNTATDS